MLEVTQLACQRGERLLFRRLGFRLDAGDILRVQAPNGMGKTSLLRQLAGLAPAEAGEIRWRGTDLRVQRDGFHAELLYLGHAAAIHDLLTPVENLRFACRAAGEALAAGEAGEVLARIGLARQLELPCKLLSQGQRRRVALARLFVARQRPLWLLDEPFTALDASAVRDLADLLTRHAEAGGMVVFTTHQDVPLVRPPRVLDLAGFAPEAAGAGA